MTYLKWTLFSFLIFTQKLTWVILSNKKIFAVQIFDFGQKTPLLGSFVRSYRLRTNVKIKIKTRNSKSCQSNNKSFGGQFRLISEKITWKRRPNPDIYPLARCRHTEHKFVANSSVKSFSDFKTKTAIMSCFKKICEFISWKHWRQSWKIVWRKFLP